MDTTADRIFELVRDTGVPERNIRGVLAKVCGVSPQATRNWQEGDTKNIGHEHLIAIAKKYKVTVDFLLTGKEEAEAAPSALPDYKGSIFATLSNDEKLAVVEQILPVLDAEGRSRVLSLLIKMG